MKENNRKIMFDGKKIVYWRECPIDVEFGLFDSLSNNIENEIIFICNKDFEDNRKKNNWDSKKIKNSKTIILNNDINLVEKLVDEFINDINIFAGITGNNFYHLKKIIKKNPKSKIFIVVERPIVYGKNIQLLWTKLTRFTYYSIMAKVFRNNIIGIFAMGEKGVKSYELYGWNPKIVFPMMYSLKSHCSSNYKNNNKESINFIYIGRFYDKIKGTDVLRDAIDKVDFIDKDLNYKLDLVGGYGKDAKKTIDWSLRKKKVNYIGSWNQNEIYDKIQNYDICIVPSRADGWNLTPNIAIDAGIASIASDESVSDELITYSKSGIIYNSKNTDELVNSIIFSCNNCDKVKEWKENAIKYKNKISNELLYIYFLDVISFCLNNYENERPLAPWKE